jgi:hypothetical protein
MQTSANELWTKLERLQIAFKKVREAEVRLAADLELKTAVAPRYEHREKPVAEDVQYVRSETVCRSGCVVVGVTLPPPLTDDPAWLAMSGRPCRTGAGRRLPR